MMAPGDGRATLLVARLDGTDYAARFEPGGRITDLLAGLPDRPDPTGSVVWGTVRRATGPWWEVDIGPDLGAGVLARKGSAMLAPGQSVPVQVVRVPAEPHKRIRLTRDIAVAGRLCVYRPLGAGHQIARGLPATERQTWRTRLDALGRRGAWIVRSRAATCDPDRVAAEAAALADGWPPVLRPAASGTVLLPAPSLIRMAWTDGAAVDAIAMTAEVGRPADLPATAPTPARLWTDAAGPWLDRLAETVHEAERPDVALPGGGTLTIETTRALTAMDVDSPDGERTAEATNRHAVTACAQALRLRNIGGLVVIDLLKLPDPQARDRVMAAFAAAVADDPRTVALSPRLSPLGLAELSRPRRGRSLAEVRRLVRDRL